MPIRLTKLAQMPSTPQASRYALAIPGDQATRDVDHQSRGPAMGANADANIETHTSITYDPPALSKDPHATAMLPSGHPDLRCR
jgi:hypothetical protein